MPTPQYHCICLLQRPRLSTPILPPRRLQLIFLKLASQAAPQAFRHKVQTCQPALHGPSQVYSSFNLLSAPWPFCLPEASLFTICHPGSAHSPPFSMWHAPAFLCDSVRDLPTAGSRTLLKPAPEQEEREMGWRINQGRNCSDDSLEKERVHPGARVLSLRHWPTLN